MKTEKYRQQINELLLGLKENERSKKNMIHDLSNIVYMLKNEPLQDIYQTGLISFNFEIMPEIKKLFLP